MNELIKERNEIAKQLLLNGGDVRECVRTANRLMKDMHGDEWDGTKETTQQAITTDTSFGYNISIVENANGEKWVRVQALGEDFVIATEDINNRDDMTYDEAMKELESVGVDTFNRKQGFIIATLIEEINAKLVEAGGNEFAKDVYISSELWKPVGSSADYNGSLTWYFGGNYGWFYYLYRCHGNFRCRPVLAFAAFKH